MIIVGKTEDISLLPNPESKPGTSTPDDAHNSFKYNGLKVANHYELFKLYKINLSKDDANSLENAWYDIEEIYFTVQNGTVDD